MLARWMLYHMGNVSSFEGLFCLPYFSLSAFVSTESHCFVIFKEKFLHVVCQM
jgi:hypothetical protein